MFSTNGSCLLFNMDIHQYRPHVDPALDCGDIGHYKCDASPLLFSVIPAVVLAVVADSRHCGPRGGLGQGPAQV